MPSSHRSRLRHPKSPCSSTWAAPRQRPVPPDTTAAGEPVERPPVEMTRHFAVPADGQVRKPPLGQKQAGDSLPAEAPGLLDDLGKIGGPSARAEENGIMAVGGARWLRKRFHRPRTQGFPHGRRQRLIPRGTGQPASPP